SSGDFRVQRGEIMSSGRESLELTVARLAQPLTPAIVRRVHRAYVARSLGELLHERLLRAHVEVIGPQRAALSLAADDPDVVWRCQAAMRSLDYLRVEPDSIERLAPSGAPWNGDAAQLFLDFQRTIGMLPGTLARFLEETAQTLYSDAFL